MKNPKHMIQIYKDGRGITHNGCNYSPCKVRDLMDEVSKSLILEPGDYVGWIKDDRLVLVNYKNYGRK